MDFVLHFFVPIQFMIFFLDQNRSDRRKHIIYPSVAMKVTKEQHPKVNKIPLVNTLNPTIKSQHF